MVLCPECGLNTCSAGENCNRCKEAYEYMYSHDAPVGAELQQLKDEEQAEYDKACAESPDNIYCFLCFLAGMGLDIGIFCAIFTA